MVAYFLTAYQESECERMPYVWNPWGCAFPEVLVKLDREPYLLWCQCVFAGKSRAPLVERYDRGHSVVISVDIPLGKDIYVLWPQWCLSSQMGAWTEKPVKVYWYELYVQYCRGTDEGFEVRFTPDGIPDISAIPKWLQPKRGPQ